MENEVIVENEGLTEETNQPRKKEALKLPALYVPALLTIETCGYFDAGYKRKFPTKQKPSKIITAAQNHRVKIIPTQEYGFPNSDDLDFKRALDRLCDEQAKRVERTNPDGTRTYHYHLLQPICVPTKKLLRYAGRGFSAPEKRAVRDYLKRGTFTGIDGELQDPKTREYGSVAFSLFSQVAIRGEKTKDGSIAETNLVWLSPYALRAYYWRLTRRMDLNFHNQLTKAISKTLIPYLDTGWFAAGGKVYTKSYTALCDLLSLPTFKYISRIRQQLDPTHEELKTLGYLDRWHYRQNDNKEYFITWHPGPKWFEDQKARGQDFTLTLSAPAEAESKSNGHAGDPVAIGRVGDPEQNALAELLANDILAVLHDRGSRQFYLKVARILPEQDIRRILAEIKADILHNPASKVRNPAAIFTVRVKDIAREQGIVL